MGRDFEVEHGIQGACTGMASATFGLIIGGIIGGPLAKLLINRHNLAIARTDQQIEKRDSTPMDINSTEYIPFEYPHQVRLITADNAITTLGLFAGCLALQSL